MAAAENVPTDENTMRMHVGVASRQFENVSVASSLSHKAHAAHQGWVSLRLDDKTNWNEVKNLLQEADRQVALKRMLKALDGDKHEP